MSGLAERLGMRRGSMGFQTNGRQVSHYMEWIGKDCFDLDG